MEKGPLHTTPSLVTLVHPHRLSHVEGFPVCLQRARLIAQSAEKLSQVQTLVKVCNSFNSCWRLSLVLGKPLESILLPALYLEESEFSNAFSGQP